MKNLNLGLSLIGTLILLLGCNRAVDQQGTGTEIPPQTQSQDKPKVSVAIPFEKFELENGLDVVLHIDKSDPVVAINLAAHVGSARELPGRTGFAHLFEHLLFLDSENLGYGGLDEMNTRIGGEGTNGFTTTDMTQYFQAVPADALEKIIWAEADKLGYFINTVTQDVLDNEKQVVKNEKRQSNDNRPYGHTFYVIGKALYPEDHPYNWQVIGSLADLDAATLDDVKDFYHRWYVPNNVTLTITGDFDPKKARKWVEKYFGEIPRGEDITPFSPRPGVLNENIALYHEDNFAKVPQLTMVWPTLEQYHPDNAALNILADYLTNGKRAPLNEILIDEQKLTSSVSMFNNASEIAGELYLSVTANAGGDLDALMPAIQKGFTRFETDGISQSDLDRIKAGLEVSVYEQLQSVLGKAIQLSEYNLFTNDPGFLSKDIDALLNVSTEDVMRVYENYIKDKTYITTSFVPKGQIDLALEGAQKAAVVEEQVVQGAEKVLDFDPRARTFEPTASSFDRTTEPPFGKAYKLPEPTIWRAGTDQSLSIYGIENDETPLIYFSIRIDAGRARGGVEKPAIASLTANMLEKGTANKTTAQLEDAIRSLGSSIRVFANADGSFITGSTLARNFEATLSLVEEMLLEPRWDQEEFDILIRAINSSIDQAAGDPGAISRREASKLSYDANHIFHYQPYGTKEKLALVNLEDLKNFYAQNYTLQNAKLRIVGNVKPDRVKKMARTLEANWQKTIPNTPRGDVTLAQAKPVNASQAYFYDIPGAKQSILNIRRPSLNALDPDYPLANAVNFLLGNIYTSRLNTALRVEKGYTYGIGSGFTASKDRGTFSVRSSVRSNVTLEAMALIRDIVGNYGASFTEDDLSIMKGALLRGQALGNETLGAKLSLLGQISAYDYPDNYRQLNAKKIEAMTLADFKAIAAKYLRTDAMNWLVVGDAKTQKDRLEELGFGPAILLNEREE